MGPERPSSQNLEQDWNRIGNRIGAGSSLEVSTGSRWSNVFSPKFPKLIVTKICNGEMSKLEKSARRDDGVRVIHTIYRRIVKLSDGTEGGVSGFNGSIWPKSFAKILRALCVKGVDYGAASGRVLLSNLPLFCS